MGADEILKLFVTIVELLLTVFFLMAVFRLFSIDRTLKSILAELSRQNQQASLPNRTQRVPRSE